MEVQQGTNSCRLFLLLLLLICQLPLSISLHSRNNQTDRLSLLAIKAQIVEDPLGRLMSWNESVHFCQWYGVKCGSRRQRVVELDLNSSQLGGSLAPHIGNLSFLRIINLENNSLSQGLPPELGRLFRLQMLGLGYNMLSGEIPVNISRCSSLLILSLSFNDLAGELPAELGSLSRLQVLNLSRNNLVSEIPSSLGNLSSLEEIYGTRNNFHGNIPDSVGQLKRLQVFAFGANNVSGTIPASIYNLSSLTILSVPVNQLHGSLPLDLGKTLPNLRILRFHTNQFTGPIPPSISNASELVNLSISRNKFTGKVPTLAKLHNLQRVVIDKNFLGNDEDDDLNFLNSLANSTGLLSLVISDNNLGGVLPEVLCNFSELIHMGFGRNHIRGSIPTEIGNLVNLVALGLETNLLTGIIPSSIGKLKKLNDLYFNGNRISGSIPSSLGNMTSLGRVNLRLNNLQGSIPSSLGNCSQLLALSISQNSLSGQIPKEVIGISSLTMALVLSENKLTGPLPLEVGRLVNLGTLDISKNMLSGEIPSSLGSCISLESLHVEENFFQGTIPNSWSSLRAIQDLNLSHNNFSGQIPKYLVEFTLGYLDLSYNDLAGEVPVGGVFENGSAFSIVGNKKLCGGLPQLHLPTCNPAHLTKSKSSAKSVIAIVSGIVGAILMICVLFFYYRRKRTHKQSSGTSPLIPFLEVTYAHVLKATNGFCSENLIGTGNFGSVYRGTLELNETVVAVKVLNLRQKGASKSFMAECQVLRNIRHRNLVKILTACSSIDFQGNDFKALVYEYMVNGSLEEWLHPTDQPDNEHELRHLSLMQRLSIAIDVANALDYLHNHCDTPIVHCDLKPGNVLLDNDMTAHVGDFGLARFLEENSHQSPTSRSSSIVVKGTIGYAAPEYGMGTGATTSGDVYSYGILLLELFTGRRPTDGMFKDGLNLHNFVRTAFPDRVVEVVHSMILPDEEETFSEGTSSAMENTRRYRILKHIMSIVKVGVACSAELPRERMDIGRAATELQRIGDILEKELAHQP